MDIRVGFAVEYFICVLALLTGKENLQVAMFIISVNLLFSRGRGGCLASFMA